MDIAHKRKDRRSAGLFCLMESVPASYMSGVHGLYKF
jgi:hypothetical protein